MNGKELLEKMELIDPEYIEAADRPKRKRPLMLPQWGALAACLMLFVAVAVISAMNPSQLETVTISSGDTASLFGDGGLGLAVSLMLLVAAGGIFAYIMKKRKK